MAMASMTRSAAILLAALAGIWLAAGPAAAQIVLDGTYDGMAEATGARIEISPDPGGFRGRFRGTDGSVQTFEADRRGDQAETVLDLAAGAVLMQMSPLPYGAEVVFIPFLPDGRLDLDRATLRTFLREGLDLPDVPEGYVDAPRDTRDLIAANSFLVSYEFWRPAGVVNGYLSLAPRFRTLMRLFPAVQLDVIWKLCLAPRADAALAMALDGQGVNCDAVVGGIAAAQATGRFNAYKREVAEAREALRTQVRCADGYIMPRGACEASARAIAEAAVRLETAASVLARYR